MTSRNRRFYKMKSMKKLIAVICAVLLLAIPLAAFSDEQPQGSTGIEKSSTPSDTQQGGAPDMQAVPQPDPQTPIPTAEQPAENPDK
jgi:hypothetical protein